MSYDSIFRPGLFDGQTIIVTGGGGGGGPPAPPPPPPRRRAPGGGGGGGAGPQRGHPRGEGGRRAG
ncbi:hypothetical protein OFD62_02310, partial [Pseudomonas aeruginosa]